MKIVYALIALVGIIGGVMLFITQGNKDSVNTRYESSAQKGRIILYKEQGEVSYKEQNATSYTVLQEAKKEIANTTSVITNKVGRAYVILPDNSTISIGTGTEIVIDYKASRTSILQLLGTTYHRISSLAKGDEYEIKTPNTLAAVRGTKLAVAYYPQNKKTGIVVTEHTVEVTPFDLATGKKKAPSLIQEGRGAEITTTSSSSGKGEDMTMKTGEEKDMPSLTAMLQEERAMDTLYDSTPKERRQEMMETMITRMQETPSDTTRHQSRLDMIKNIIRTMEPSPRPSKDSSTNIIERKDATRTLSQESVTKEPSTVTPPQEPEQEPTTTSLKTIDTSKNTFTQEEQLYIDSFYELYERLFYVQDVTAYCQIITGLTGEQMVGRLTTYATQKGYTLPKKDQLSSFAKELVTSCSAGTLRQNTEALQTKFDSVYPY